MLSIDDQIEALFGRRELPRDAGVLHVTALTQRPDGYRTIVIDEGSPRSPRDFFSLQLARARADAIIITGKLLRDEAALDYTFRGPHAEALAAWRQSVQKRKGMPTLVVLTRSGRLPAEHPIWRAATETIVLTGAAGETEAKRRLPDTQVERLAQPGLIASIELVESMGAKTIALEAGPSTTRAAYDAGRVDELMLSTFLGPFSDSMKETSAPFDLEQLQSALPTSDGSREFTEPSGTWHFERRSR